MLNFRMRVRIKSGAVRFSDDGADIIGYTYKKKDFPALVVKWWDKDDFLKDLNRKQVEQFLTLK